MADDETYAQHLKKRHPKRNVMMPAALANSLIRTGPSRVLSPGPSKQATRRDWEFHGYSWMFASRRPGAALILPGDAVDNPHYLLHLCQLQLPCP